MNEVPVLPADVRGTLPPVVQIYLAYLEAELIQQGHRLADLEARLSQHSGNSSRPPSTDSPAAPPRPTQPASGRTRGGQRGHPGHTRLQLNADAIAEIVIHRLLQHREQTITTSTVLG